MASTDVRNDDAANLTESMNRVGLNDAGDDNRVGPDGEPAPRTDEEYAQSQLTLRAIVSSKEAGVIIGKAGKNVADLRDETGVKAGVSKVVQGVHDRVLTVSGGLEGISKAYAIVAKGLLEGAPQMGMGGVISSNGTHREYSQLFCPPQSSSDIIGDVHQPMLLVKVSKLRLTIENYSDSASYLSQSDGNHHWQTRSQDQAYTGRLRGSHGCPERDAPSVD